MNRKPFFATISAVLLSLGALAGCGDSDTGGATTEGGGHTHISSACGTEGDTYVANLEKAGTKGLLTVTLVDAQPAPPAQGDNHWMLQVTHADGVIVEDATLEVVPFMPEHGHGSSVTPVITPMTGGMYDVDLVNFFMPGLWEITIRATATDATTDDAIFNFCIDG